MKLVVIDEDLCQGARECASIAPEAVIFSDDGVARGTDTVLADGIAAHMEAVCPSMAITTIDVASDEADDNR